MPKHLLVTSLKKLSDVQCVHLCHFCNVIVRRESIVFVKPKSLVKC